MTIGTDALIKFSGTQDQVDSSSGSVANDAFSVAGDVSDWTNDDDSPGAFFTLRAQFATMPTVGSISLHCAVLNIQSTNDESDVDSSNDGHFLGEFKIDFGIGNATNFYAGLHVPELPPGIATSQIYRFFIKNNGTSQTVTAGWGLWVTPTTHGPHA